jgi:arylformamidase
MLAAGDSSQVSEFRLGAHAGTHIDLPAHFITGAPTLESLPPERFILPAVVADNGRNPVVEEAIVSESGALTGEALLIRTENSRRGILTGEAFVEQYVHLSPGAARACVELGLALVGLDAHSVDPFASENYPAHNILLPAGVLILEGIDLARIDPGRYTLSALPLKISDAEASPVRAVLLE